MSQRWKLKAKVGYSFGQVWVSEKDYDIHISNKVRIINDNKRGLIARVNMSPNRLFPLKINYDSLSCFNTAHTDENWL